MKTTSRAIVAVLGAALLTALLGACGSGSPGAQALLSDTFHSKTPIESGHLDLALTLVGSGSSALKQPVSITLAGPFQSSDPHKLPSFDLQAGMSVAGHTLTAGAISTSNGFYVQLAGTSFQAPESAVRALQQSYARTPSSSSGSGSSALAALGIEPASWLVDPVEVGTSQVGGTETIHLVANLNVARFLAQAGRLSREGGALGLSGQKGSLSGLISPEAILALARAVRSAKVDVYTGAEDHMLRRMILTATLGATGHTDASLEGLRTAKLSLELNLSDLNRPQTIVAPAGARPMSELVSALQQLGVVSGASGSGGAGSSTGSSTAGGSSSSASSAATQTPAGTGSEGTSSEAAGPAGAPATGSGSSSVSGAYLECARKAGQSIAALQRCASLLHG